MSDFSNAEVGLKVALIEPWGWSHVRIKQAEVERAGKNFLQVGGVKFTRRGNLHGGSYRSSRIEPWDEIKHPRLIEETNADIRLAAMRQKLSGFRWSDLDMETAEAVLALVTKQEKSA